MSSSKKILLALLLVFIAVQFIQPARNQSGQALATDITKVYTIPENVQVLFKMACYDCHSNNTNYPWYANLQPGRWWLERHIKAGKEELNFNEFGTYSARRQMSKLRSIENSIEDGTMPLTSYTLIHKDARLTNEEKATIIAWLNETQDSLTLQN
ncbi:heme-binding domain-containing protein [Pontibacter sp. 172403-2]|uniref:heme-binding domain-containing protein n=1 Tax=Pontibacter rufus TaxID=2791028 RepID=UPI0018AFBBEB|nr:heme-binding domain-containing protein [Pontibacter sp. 172403-2]MBF9252201.1 heme-binding domain-containing protein [Pontibacter sp. 172403-2]